MTELQAPNDQTTERFDLTRHPPAERWHDWLYDPKLRGIASQIIVVLLLLWGLYEIIVNTQANLKKLNQNFGFDFLAQAVGFRSFDGAHLLFFHFHLWPRPVGGLLNTALVAVLGIVLATILGFIVGVMRLSKNWVVSRAATLYIEIVRNIPLLLQIFIWYALVLKPLPGPKQAVQFCRQRLHQQSRHHHAASDIR